MKPFLFLDVDGVLNVFPQQGIDQPTILRHTLSDGGKLFTPAGTPGRIDVLAKNLEPVWATAWMGSANRALSDTMAMNVHWPHVSYFGYKLPEIVKFADGRPWVWIDDDAEWELRQLDWNRERHLAGNLIISPNSNVGLTTRHVEMALDFARDAC